MMIYDDDDDDILFDLLAICIALHEVAAVPVPSKIPSKDSINPPI